MKTKLNITWNLSILSDLPKLILSKLICDRLDAAQNIYSIQIMIFFLLQFIEKETNCKQRNVRRSPYIRKLLKFGSVFSRKKKAMQIFSEPTPTDRIVIQILHGRHIFIFIFGYTEWEAALSRIASSLLAGRNVKFGRETHATFFCLVTRAIWRT